MQASTGQSHGGGTGQPWKNWSRRDSWICPASPPSKGLREMQGLKIHVCISCCTPLHTDRCLTPLRVSVICRKLMKCVDDHKYQRTKHMRLATKPVIFKIFVLCCTFATHLPFIKGPISKPSFSSTEVFSNTIKHSNLRPQKSKPMQEGPESLIHPMLLFSQAGHPTAQTPAPHCSQAGSSTLRAQDTHT